MLQLKIDRPIINYIDTQSSRELELLKLNYIHIYYKIYNKILQPKRIVTISRR